jgi:mRNA interferase RelE/StbE
VADYRVVVKSSAVKELERLPHDMASRALRKIAALASEPRPAGVRKLKGSPARWRLRIGEWRVIYEIDDRQRLVDIVYIRHRSAAYD